MHPTLTTEAFAALGAPDLVYIRPLRAADIVKDLPPGHVLGVDPAQTVYGVYRADGQRIAVLDDRDTAFATAHNNDLAPVSVH